MLHLAIAAALALAAADPGAATIDDLAWLSGDWESLSGETWVEEVWTAPRGGTLFATSRTGRGDQLREFEFVRLQPGEDGRLAYHASPNGRGSFAFPLVELDGTSAAFANPAHDYPQLIRYRRDGDTLTATISLSDGSNAHSWTFHRKR